MAEQVQEGGNADREHPSSTQTEAEEEESSGTAEQEVSSRGTAKYATLQEAVLAGDRAAIREMMTERDGVLKRKREEEKKEEEEERESKRRRIEEEEKDIELYSDRYWARTLLNMRRLGEKHLGGNAPPELLRWLIQFSREHNDVREYFSFIDMEFLDGTEDAYDEVREERRAGFYPEDKEEVFNAAKLPPLCVYAFAIDGSGGIIGFWWREGVDVLLDACPVVVWDSEGSIGLMARDLKQYLSVILGLNEAQFELVSGIEDSIEFPVEWCGKEVGEDGQLPEERTMEEVDRRGRTKLKEALEEKFDIRVERRPFDVLHHLRSESELAHFKHYVWLCLE